MVSIPKSEVDRVSVARKKKARNTAIGAAIGGGVGLRSAVDWGQRSAVESGWLGREKTGKMDIQPSSPG